MKYQVNVEMNTHDMALLRQSLECMIQKSEESRDRYGAVYPDLAAAYQEDVDSFTDLLSRLSSCYLAAVVAASNK